MTDKKSWKVEPVDGYDKPTGDPVFVRAETKEKAENAGKFWLNLLGVKKVRRVSVRPWNPAADRDYGIYIFPTAPQPTERAA